MFKEKPFWYKWVSAYLFHIFVSYASLYVLMMIAKKLLFTYKKTWLNTDPGYSIFHMIDDNRFAIFCLVSFMITIFWAIYHFCKFGKAVDQTIQAVGNIYDMPEESVKLPKMFREMELALNEVRIKSHIDRQTAKEATQRKNDLIMYMAHDLKTPLTSVIGYLSLVCNEPTIPMDIKEKYMGIALRKSYRLEDLINEFFDITRFNFSQLVLEKSTVNLSMMVQQIVSEFDTEFSKKNLTVNCDIEPDVMAVCDVGKMERVFDNLLKNIVNYSYTDSEIHLSLHRTEENQMEIVTENPGKTIPPEMLAHIFDQFFRLDTSRSTKTGGSGLGLAVAKEIVTAHHGTIFCESKDEIIRFNILLPASS